jgi:hypothetical protein
MINLTNRKDHFADVARRHLQRRSATPDPCQDNGQGSPTPTAMSWEASSTIDPSEESAPCRMSDGHSEFGEVAEESGGDDSYGHFTETKANAWDRNLGHGLNEPSGMSIYCDPHQDQGRTSTSTPDFRPPFADIRIGSILQPKTANPKVRTDARSSTQDLKLLAEYYNKVGMELNATATRCFESGKRMQEMIDHHGEPGAILADKDMQNLKELQQGRDPSKTLS